MQTDPALEFDDKVTKWLGGATVGCWTCDRMIVGSIPGRNTIKWLLLG